MWKFFSTVFLFLFLSIPVFSASDPLSDKTLLLKKTDESLARSDWKAADFYAARYMGLCDVDPTDCSENALEAFNKKRKLEPKAFIPGEWDPDFLSWFETCVRARWGVESSRVREKARSFEITQTTYENKYFVTVAAYPELQQWHILENGLITKTLLMPMASFRDRPVLFFGRITKGIPTQSRPFFLDTQKRTLHYVWKPEFFDVDGDGIPELWVRFNLTWGNGYTQVLDVYRIRKDEGLELLHHFQGDPDGYARRLEDGAVEVAGALRSQNRKYIIETWKFSGKSFKKSSSKEWFPKEESEIPPSVARI